MVKLADLDNSVKKDVGGNMHLTECLLFLLESSYLALPLSTLNLEVQLGSKGQKVLSY